MLLVPIVVAEIPISESMRLSEVCFQCIAALRRQSRPSCECSPIPHAFAMSSIDSMSPYAANQPLYSPPHPPPPYYSRAIPHRYEIERSKTWIIESRGEPLRGGITRVMGVFRKRLFDKRYCFRWLHSDFRLGVTLRIRPIFSADLTTPDYGSGRSRNQRSTFLDVVFKACFSAIRDCHRRCRHVPPARTVSQCARRLRDSLPRYYTRTRTVLDLAMRKLNGLRCFHMIPYIAV